MSIKNNIKKIVEKIKTKKVRNMDEIQEIDYESLKQMLKENSNAIVVDVRSAQEHRESKLSPSINIPLYDLDLNAESILPNKNQTIVLYCQSGVRSIKAYKILQRKGYTNLYTLAGGLDGIE